MYKPIRKIGRSEKLLLRWHGPYVVQRRTSALNYEVKGHRARKTELVYVGKMKKLAGGTRGEGEEEQEADSRSTKDALVAQEGDQSADSTR